MSDTSSRAWSWRHAIIRSDLPATTRHVLLTISCYMNDLGGGCYPSQKELEAATGLTDRSVRQHIALAEEKGWIERREHGFRGRKWRNHEYVAKWPARSAAEPEDILDVDEGAEGRSAPQSATCGTSFREVRKDVPPILPVTSNTPLPPKTAEPAPAQDVVATHRYVDAVQDEDLYAECCSLSGHKRSITDRRGGWTFPTSIVEEALARLRGRLI